MPEKVLGITSGFDRTKILQELPGTNPHKYLLGVGSIGDSLFSRTRTVGEYVTEIERMTLNTRFEPTAERKANSLINGAVDLSNGNTFNIEHLPSGNYLITYNRPDEETGDLHLFSAIVRLEHNGFSISSTASTERLDLFTQAYQAHIEMSDRLGNLIYEAVEMPLPTIECSMTPPEVVYASLPTTY